MAPYLLKAPRRNPVKLLAGFTFAYVLMFLGSAFLFTAGFIWTASNFGYDVAFAVGGVALFISAFILLAVLERPKKNKRASKENLNDDPIGSLLPDTLKQDPAIQSLVKQVSDNPIISSLAALIIGLFLARELFEET